MRWTSILAIYLLIWTMSAFLLLPFGVKTHDEMGLERTPGQADSAPGNFRPARILLGATILATILCTLFVANYIEGWITPQDINFFSPPPSLDPNRQG